MKVRGQLCHSGFFCERVLTYLVIFCMICSCFPEDFVLITDTSADVIYKSIIPQQACNPAYLQFSTISGLTPSWPVPVEYDHVEDFVYWADVNNHTIYRNRLDGSDLQIIVQSETNVTLEVRSIALDTVNRKMYYADVTTKNIMMSNLNGTDAMQIRSNMAQVRGLVINVNKDMCFVAQRKKVARFTLSDNSNLLIQPADGWVLDVAVDFTDENVYWVDDSDQLIRISNLDFENVREFVNLSIALSGRATVRGLSLYKASVYWVIVGDHLFRADKVTGDNVEIISEITFTNPFGLFVYDDPNWNTIEINCTTETTQDPTTISTTETTTYGTTDTTTADPTTISTTDATTETTTYSTTDKTTTDSTTTISTTDATTETTTHGMTYTTTDTDGKTTNAKTETMAETTTYARTDESTTTYQESTSREGVCVASKRDIKGYFRKVYTNEGQEVCLMSQNTSIHHIDSIVGCAFECLTNSICKGFVVNRSHQGNLQCTLLNEAPSSSGPTMYDCITYRKHML